MSARKKSNNGIQDVHKSIMGKLSKCKPMIEGRNDSDWSVVAQELSQITTLSENFSELRLKNPKGTWSDLADSLDQEGVNLWNLSGLMRKSPEEPDRNNQIAALRLAALRLIEAGLETKPGVETLIHVLQLANKTGALFTELGNITIAVNVLTSAAKYEEQLRHAKPSNEEQRCTIACASVLYYSNRMEAAWKEGNHTVSNFMSKKVVDDTQRLGLLPAYAQELLVHKLHQIGISLLKESSIQEGMRPTDAVIWLQRAFSVAEQLDGTPESAASSLKISIMRAMARAYFLAELYDRAEAVLDELVPIVDSSDSHTNSEYQELRWLRLAVLKRRKAPISNILNAFKSLVDHMVLNDANLTDVLHDLKTLGNHNLITDVHQHCLQQMLQLHTTEPDQIHKVILSLIIHTSKDDDHARAMKTLESSFKSVCDADFEFSGIPATACLTLIWQYGGRYYKVKKWPEAAAWFTAGSHALFRQGSPSSSAKCLRKAALCHIEQREYALASTVIRRCPTNEASTHYVIFLTAIHQGLEDEAIRAIHDMLKAPDFDRKLLLLATQVSHQSEMKGVLLAVLENLLKTLKTGTNGEVIVEAMTLVRCTVKLVLGLLLQPSANKSTLIDTVLNQFRTARMLTESASAQKSFSLVFKDISWLWRTAYNCAVQGCSEWEDAGDQISELFDIAKELLEACCAASPVSIDADLCLHIAQAAFAAVSGRVFSARELRTSSVTIDEGRLRAILIDIRGAKSKIIDMSTNSIVQSDQLPYFIHALRTFEVEFCVHLKAWDEVAQVIEEVTTSGYLAVGTYEAIVDILWIDPACPVDVLYKCLEAILRASLEHSCLSVERFSRWLRTICTISLSRNTPTDRLKAVHYFEQAVSVLEDRGGSEGGESYPLDERHWLLGTAYNTGTECLHSSLIDEAKRWFEISTTICRYVPGGQERAEKISETYTKLLSHYGARS